MTSAGAVPLIRVHGISQVWATACRYSGLASGNTSADISACMLATELMAELASAKIVLFCEASLGG